MVADFQLDAGLRTVLGKKVKHLRRGGVTPANVYGHGVQSIAIEINAHDLMQMATRAGGSRIVTLRFDSGREPVKVLIRGLQWDPRTGGLLHVDFQAISEQEEVTVKVPIILIGEAPGVRTHTGVLARHLDSLQVQALPQDIPATIELDISTLQLDEALRVRDLKLPPGVKTSEDLDGMVVRVARPTVEVVPEAEAAPSGALVPTEEMEAEEDTGKERT